MSVYVHRTTEINNVCLCEKEQNTAFHFSALDFIFRTARNEGRKSLRGISVCVEVSTTHQQACFHLI